MTDPEDTTDGPEPVEPRDDDASDKSDDDGSTVDHIEGD